MPNVYIIGDRTTQDVVVVETDDISVAVAKYAEIYGTDEASTAPITNLLISDDLDQQVKGFTK